MNGCSITLFLVILGITIIGGIGGYTGHLWGLIPFLVGGLLLVKGFQGPQSTAESPSRKVWLLSMFGQRTKIIAHGLTFILNWPFNIIGYIEIDMKVINKKFPLEKPIFCPGDESNLYGLVSVAFSPDDSDEINKDGTIKCGGEKLQEFCDMGEMEGVFSKIDKQLTVWVQEIASQDNHDTIWMETHGAEIEKEMVRRMLDSGDSRTNFKFWIKVYNCAVLLNPAKKVSKARDQVLVESAEKGTQMTDTETMNERAELRLAFHRSAGNTDITTEEVRQELFEEDALNRKQLKIVMNPGGINITTSAV